MLKLLKKLNFTSKTRVNINDIPSIRSFINNKPVVKFDTYINTPANHNYTKEEKKFFIETYGCQMNENDTDIITTILENNKYTRVNSMEEANVILTNTCAIRDSAEEKVWKNIIHIKGIKKRDPSKIFGILGCMAERMKEKIIEKSDIVDLIVGPDAYRDLPKMIDILSNEDNNHKHAMNVQLSLEETYGDIIPVRKNGIKAFLSIMRGCNNMCSFCIVPFTRGRERSRSYSSIEDEVKYMAENGIREITLLGQNVNSFVDETYLEGVKDFHENTPGFKELYKLRNKKGMRFAELIDKLSDIAPDIRFRFTSPHPKDFPEDLLEVIKSKNNICKQIHLPAQSGNNEVLKNMRRFYTREAYLELVYRIREKIPLISLSSDFIAGFCGETEEQFHETISLIEEVKYDMTYLFSYSMRDKTHAYHNMVDNISQEVKKDRLNRMIEVFKKHQLDNNKKEIGKHHIILVEGNSQKKNKTKLIGRTDTNKICIFNNEEIPVGYNKDKIEKINIGDLIMVRINDCSNNTLFGQPINKVKYLSEFFNISNGNPYY